MILNLVLLCGTFVGTIAFQWTSSATFPNGTRVNVCLGDTVTFPWRFSINSSEQIIDIEWYQVSQKKKVGGWSSLNIDLKTDLSSPLVRRFPGTEICDNREILLAGYISNQFLAYGNLGNRLHFVSNAGLRLSGVTLSDMGQYSVLVNLNGDQKASQIAFLHEPEAPVTQSGSLQAYILPTTQFPIINGESHLQLACGNFLSLGEPPITVTWRKPSGQLISSVHNNSVFTLTLPNPIEGGNYTCQLPIPQHCLQNNTLFQRTSTVYVDDVTWSLLLLRNDMEWLREENARLTEAYISQFELLDAAIHPFSCLRVKDYDEDNRIHTIYPMGFPVKVYCDQSTVNGGWTVIQRRQDGSVDFYRNWTEYEYGFGNPESEYWIGLANLYAMTRVRTASLRIDLMDFHHQTGYVMYNFSVSGPEDNYRLHISSYTGSTGDALINDNNKQFSTYDREHDDNSFYNCAEQNQGAWWYSNCSLSNLNGRFYQNEVHNQDCIFWYPFHENNSLKRVEIKIRV